MAARVRAWQGQSQQSGASSGSPIWVAEIKHVGPLLVLFPCHQRGPDWKGSSQDMNWCSDRVMTLQVVALPNTPQHYPQRARSSYLTESHKCFSSTINLRVYFWTPGASFSIHLCVYPHVNTIVLIALALHGMF